MTKHTPDNDIYARFKGLELGGKTKLKTIVYRFRRGIRDRLGGKDILDAEGQGKPRKVVGKLRTVYRKADSFMARFFPSVVKETPRDVAMAMVVDVAGRELGYRIVDVDSHRPWGGFIRIANDEADRFISEFFPGLSPHDARLGNDDLELSPKLLLVAPGQRLSWQYHHRRAERWRFLNKGSYYKSTTDDPGELIYAPADTVVQFDCGERHRLCSADNENYTLVAEIWQHTDPKQLSNEDDIVRLHDDYRR